MSTPKESIRTSAETNLGDFQFVEHILEHFVILNHVILIFCVEVDLSQQEQMSTTELRNC